MIKTIKKSIALISIFILCLCMLPTAQAKEVNPNTESQKIISEETINTAEYNITISVFEDINNTNGITPLASTYEKSGKKTYTAKNNDGDTLFSFTVHGTFSVQSGVSASCTKASYSYSITDNIWELKSASASRSGNKAVGDAEFIKKILFITVDSLEPHIVLTCDSNGKLS